LAAFGEDPNRTEDFERDGVFFYRIAIESARYSQKFVVWVTMVGEPRNVSCAIFVDRIRQHLDTRAVVLLGIAGGNKDKVKIGDVVASYEILDDDGVVDNYLSTVNLFKLSFDIRKRQSRVRIIDHYGRLKRLLTNFSEDAPDWKSRRNAVIAAGDRGALKFNASDLETSVDYKPGLIQAGDRLKKDGSLPSTSVRYHDKLFAVEMEGSGFGQSAAGRRIG
jgi:nucleoside phosphorylase